jgi:hypothetical protein
MQRLLFPDRPTVSTITDSCRVAAGVALDPVNTKIPAQPEGQTVLDRRPPNVYQVHEASLKDTNMPSSWVTELNKRTSTSVVIHNDRREADVWQRVDRDPERTDVQQRRKRKMKMKRHKQTCILKTIKFSFPVQISLTQPKIGRI